VGAITFDEGLRAWLLDEDLCTGCGDCVVACPFDAIWLDPISGLAFKCDLCSGAVRCVEVCPSKALTIRGLEKESVDGK
jgi:Fe-S-cluster-containing hydrogenase component 2